MSDSKSQAKVAVITGASSGTLSPGSLRVHKSHSSDYIPHDSGTGIGKTTAITFAKAGWSVVLFARRADRLHETVSECPDAEKTLIVQGNVTDEAAVERLFKEAVERFGMSFPSRNERGGLLP